MGMSVRDKAFAPSEVENWNRDPCIKLGCLNGYIVKKKKKK